MSSARIFRTILYVLICTGLHLFITREFAVFGMAFCYLYVGAILFLPIESNSILVMIGAFVLGFLVDGFYDSAGVHSGASVLLAFLRPQVLRLLKPPGDYEEYMEVSLPIMGAKWYLQYMALLLLGHHLMVFILSYSRFADIGLIVVKATFSSVFTLVGLLLVQYSFTGRK